MKKKNHIDYGLIGAGILCALFVIQWFAKVSFGNVAFSILPIAVYAGIIIVCCMNFSKINNAEVSFGEVFSNAFKASAVITVISALFFVAFLLLVPDYKDAYLEYSASQSANAGNPEAAAQGREFVEKRFIPIMLAGSLFINLLTGVIASLIGAAIAKKKK